MLHGKTIVVIGGTAGLGRSAALACVAAGAHVVAVGRDSQRCRQLERLGSGRIRTVAADATHPDTACQAMQQAAHWQGAVHGLYHVAGGSGRSAGDGPLDQLTDQGWQQTLHWNLDSLFYSNRAALRQFLAQGTGGSILNMSSVLAFSPSPTYFATHAYAAAKAAVIGLSRSAAAYYARHGIRVNVIAPALVATKMSQRAQAEDAITRFISCKQPLDGGRIGTPRDLDQAVVYFLSDAARFVTGQVLCIDGGWGVTDAAAPDATPSEERPQ
jgi:NAD(P)-dependent dehydrogenase (short-subunit alcohol dehydrogenase family)